MASAGLQRAATGKAINRVDVLSGAQSAIVENKSEREAEHSIFRNGIPDPADLEEYSSDSSDAGNHMSAMGS